MLPQSPTGGFNPEEWIKRGAAARILDVEGSAVPSTAATYGIASFRIAGETLWYRADCERAAPLIAAKRETRAMS